MEEETLQEKYKNRMIWVVCFATFSPMIITLYVVSHHPGFIIKLPDFQKQRTCATSTKALPSETLVVRAKLDISKGMTITEEMLELVWVPSETQFGPLVRNFSDVVGRKSAETISHGRLIRIAQIAAK